MLAIAGTAIRHAVCSGGMCGLSCVGGTIKCGSACTNTAVDAAHCGACNKPCATGEICASGMCKLGCGIGLTQCGNACFNTAIDPAHCGVCSKACSVGEVCSAGTCGLTCGAGLTQCGNACTNTALDPQNCGICGNSCGGGKVCSNGSCKSVAPTVVQVASGYLHTCTLFSDGTVKCWGDNSSGQLGYGHTQDRGSGPNQMGELLPAIALGTGKTAKAIAAGDYHSCALLNDDSIKCWGRNTNGQLGLGDILARGDGAKEMGDLLPAILLGTGKTAKVIAAGGAYNCAILNDDTVKCWGYNASGRLGLGDATQRGSAASHMGNFLPTVALGTDKTAKGIALGDDHTCAILNDATVKCWGSNNYGELGLGDTLSRGDNANEMGDLLPAISLGVGKTTKAIAACGPSHSCAILNDDTVKCWGYNVQGQLGLGDALARGDNANEMGGNLPAVSLATGKTAKAISGGDSHTCALLNDATVKCWGYNAGGKLGLGDTTNRGSNPNHMGNLLPAVMLGTGKTALAVAAGDGHTCSVLSDLSVKCWGYNGSGRLGLGDLVNRGDDGNEMGEFLPAVLLLGL
ncbi:MAG: hypothetical protein EXR75_13860 [Myxococcales bacterium]|nr:hypothetical protein [Myxococcales bacterium]